MFFRYSNRMDLAREELIDVIAYALWRSLDLRPRNRDLLDCQVWATKVVDHLERSGIEWSKKPPIAGHSTPGK